MTRKEIFHSYYEHPWLSKLYKRLTRADFIIVDEFLKSHDQLGKGAFEKATVRMFLDKEKPKNWTIIEELLVCANSSLP